MRRHTPSIAERRSEYREAILPCINLLDGRWKEEEGGGKKKKTQVLQKERGRTGWKDLERTRSLCVRRFKGV